MNALSRMINIPVLGLLFRRVGQLVANDMPEESESCPAQGQPSAVISDIQLVRLRRHLIPDEQKTKLTPSEIDYLIRSPGEDSWLSD